ncbi:MAG: hypothetical protein A2X25_04855 [Chloroflexi bacterium GWB2_49_20]|nr:MAG: hypothetical protein A2X25_04855 [Chloroflexi bacterium GWB2_49_20]OGN80515.1 MAG: hypothetical protein A2X26_11965 [Chloroflexi bacterium GWC2_49_37]OGN83350.1 MAG: hypothetical protein A2X27_12140 [Chloroflexi bacterium GWD2_49_16]HCC78160.1 hypothetical protein [Anaerolineae bacterium]
MFRWVLVQLVPVGARILGVVLGAVLNKENPDNCKYGYNSIVDYKICGYCGSDSTKSSDLASSGRNSHEDLEDLDMEDKGSSFHFDPHLNR